MKRLLCLALLFLISLPAFAQDGPPVLGQALPNDPALLMRERERLTLEFAETHRMLSLINPNDTQLVGTLRARQTELARQIDDIVRQLQTPPSTPNIGAGFLGPDARPGMPPGFPPMQQERQIPDWRQTEPAMPPGMPMPGMQGMRTPPESLMPGLSMPLGGMGGIPPGMLVPGTMPGGMPPGFHAPMPPQMPFNPADMMPNNVPQWGNPPPDFEAAHWGPRLPRELTDVRQSIESLQREVTSLRDTIRQLETQIQLLSRNILLNERANERMNEWMLERARENGE